MRIRWTPKAEEDIELAHQFIAQDSLRAADELVDKLYAAALHLREFPKLGRLGQVRNTRELIVSGTPFYLSYRIEEEHIQILAVVHGARRRPPSRI